MDTNATYGDEPLQLEAQSTSGLEVEFFSSDPAVLEVNGTQLKVRGAGAAPIFAHPPGDGNYLPSPDLNATVTVRPAELDAIADPKTKAYLQENPELTFHYEGFVNDENASALDLEPDVSTTATASSPAGEYPITVSGGEAANYHFNLHGSGLEIGETTQQIEVFSVDTNATYGDAPKKIAAIASSGLEVEFFSSDPAVLEVNGTRLKVRGAGQENGSAHVSAPVTATAGKAKTA